MAAKKKPGVSRLLRDANRKLKQERRDELKTNDDDGASGGVVVERVYLEDCLVYDGMTYGDGDGLLTDESIVFAVGELCRLNEICGWGNLDQPVMRVEAEDCGGNVGVSTFQWQGGIRLLPGECD